MDDYIMCGQGEVDISIFIPCFNEEHNVGSTIETAVSALEEVKLSYELLIVDDCSEDNTVGVVEKYKSAHPEIPICLVKKEKRMGLGRNYVDAAYIGKGKYYTTIFGDNAQSKESILMTLRRVGDADMIIPYLGHLDVRPRVRRVVSKLFVTIVNLLSGYSLKYYNGPVVHRKFNVMRWHADTNGFAYQAEIIVRLLDEGASYIEVPVEPKNRDSGVSKAFTLQNFLSITHSLLQISLRRLRRILFER